MKPFLPALVILAVVALVTPASSQNFNIDVGQPGSQPSSAYAAAGLPGVWNSVLADHSSPFTPGVTPQNDILVDLQGNVTSVSFHQFGGMETLTANDHSVAGDDAALLNDYVATHNAIENCMYINGLVNGTYEVITYAWMPNSPETEQIVRFDSNPGVTTDVGGTWTGSHVELVTYSRDIVEVTIGRIGFHSGLGTGEPAEPGAAFCGVQLRLLGVPVPTTPRWALAALAFSTLIVGGYLLTKRVGPVRVRG